MTKSKAVKKPVKSLKSKSEKIKRIILLINLGTPASLELRDIKKYLFEFLMDPCVIDVAYPLRLFLVGGIIVPFRAPKTKKTYEEIWTDKGSPLLMITEGQASKLKKLSGDQTEVVMRYGEPSFKTVFSKLSAQIKDEKFAKLELVMVPLYPHAALSTTETVYREIDKYLLKLKEELNKIPNIQMSHKTILPFYDHTEYIKIVAKTIFPLKKKIQAKEGHLLFSYHGVPERHIKKTDPSYPPGNHCLQKENCCSVKEFPNNPAHPFCYRHQTRRTTERVVKELGLKENEYSLAYQSRLGRDPWITPYTDEMIKILAENGVKHLWVVCPAFVADNLETLFEIQIENEELFQEHGGESLTLIPCLNDRDDFIALLKKLID